MNRTRKVSQAWLDRRIALHRLLEEGTRFAGNASVLEQVGADKRVWTQDEMVSAWREVAAHPQPDAINHVYMHVPFCKSICHFCNYKRLRPGSGALMRAWAERVVGSLAALGPAVGGMPFHTLYIGGGTPSLLPVELLAEVLEAIDGALTFAPHSARFFEADPAVLDERKLAVLKAHQFQHVAMGVQTLDASVNASHDRGAQGFDMVERRVDQIRKAGIGSTSFDFLLGLHDTDPDQIFAEIERAVAELRPRWIDVFFLTPTQRYVDLHFGGSYEAFWAHQRRFADPAPAALAGICARQGYRLEGDVYDAFVLTRKAGGRLASVPVAGDLVDRAARVVARNPGWLGGLPARAVGWLQSRDEGSPYGYTQLVAEQHRPLNLLGLGTGARSRLFGRAFVTCRDPGDDPERSGPFEYVGRETDMAFEARAYLSDVLSTSNEVSMAALRRLFGADLDTVLPETLAAWHQLGLAHVTDQTLRLTPTDREARFRDLMWLLPDEVVEAEIARIRRIDLSPEALAGLVAPLGTGAALSDDWTLHGFDAGAVVLASGDKTVRVRVTPQLERRSGVDLLPEDAGAGTDLPKAVARLRKLMRRNGADELGIVEVPELRDGVVDRAGQHDPVALDGGRRLRPPRDRVVPEPVRDAASEPATPLSADRVEAYWREGYVKGVDVLTDAEVERLRRWLELIEAEQAARMGGRWEDRDFDPDVQPDHPLRVWADEIARHPRLLDAVRSLLGPDVVVRNIDVFVREPRTRDGVVWHRDSASTDPATDKMLTAWVGLNPATPENGCLQLVTGSHRGTLPGEALTADALSFGPEAVAALAGQPVVDDILEAGQASLHHIRMVHGSGGNRTRGRRIGVVVRYAAGDTPQPVLESGVAMVVAGALRSEGVQERSMVSISWQG